MKRKGLHRAVKPPKNVDPNLLKAVGWRVAPNGPVLSLALEFECPDGRHIHLGANLGPNDVAALVTALTDHFHRQWPAPEAPEAEPEAATEVAS